MYVMKVSRKIAKYLGKIKCPALTNKSLRNNGVKTLRISNCMSLKSG